MTSDGHRSARAAFDAARASFQRLDATSVPAEQAAAIRDAWQGTQRALRALAGTDVLEGVALVRELRQRNLLTLDDAHALVDFHAAAERTSGAGAAPTPGDVQAATGARDRLERLLGTGAGPGSAPFSGPVSAPRIPLPPSEPAASAEVQPPPVRRNYLGAAFVVVALLAVVAVALFAWRGMSREPSALRQGRAAFAAGDRLTAKNAFAIAATESPALAEPHIYLGRMAREEGNRAAASAELRRAVELEPDNPLAHRELAAYLLASGQLDLARSFYARAIELDPNDRVSLGFMACTLHRMGRTDLAARFFQRAGAGEWVQCQAVAPPPPGIPPGVVPGGAPPAAPR